MEAAAPEDMGLYWSVMRRTMAEAESGQRGPYYQVHRAIMGARRRVPTFGFDRTPLGYRIIDLPATDRSTDGWAASCHLHNR